MRVIEYRKAIKPKTEREFLFAFRIPILVYLLPSYPVIPELRSEIPGISCLVLLVIFGILHKERFPITVGNDVVQSVMIKGRYGMWVNEWRKAIKPKAERSFLLCISYPDSRLLVTFLSRHSRIEERNIWNLMQRITCHIRCST